jgi:hypothetical protein
MEETLTLTRLGVTGSLKRTLESTNPCESMIEIVRHTQRNVKRWSSGEMALRWTGSTPIVALVRRSGVRTLAQATMPTHQVRESFSDVPRWKMPVRGCQPASLSPPRRQRCRGRACLR